MTGPPIHLFPEPLFGNYGRRFCLGSVLELPMFHIKLRKPQDDVDRLLELWTRRPHLLSASFALGGQRMHVPVVRDRQLRAHGHDSESLSPINLGSARKDRWSCDLCDPFLPFSAGCDRRAIVASSFGLATVSGRISLPTVHLPSFLAFPNSPRRRRGNCRCLTHRKIPWPPEPILLLSFRPEWRNL